MTGPKERQKTRIPSGDFTYTTMVQITMFKGKTTPISTGPFSSSLCKSHYQRVNWCISLSNCRHIGWWFQSLWKIWVSWDDEIPNGKLKSCSKPPTSKSYSYYVTDYQRVGSPTVFPWLWAMSPPRPWSCAVPTSRNPGEHGSFAKIRGAKRGCFTWGSIGNHGKIMGKSRKIHHNWRLFKLFMGIIELLTENFSANHIWFGLSRVRGFSFLHLQAWISIQRKKCDCKSSTIRQWNCY